MKKRGCLYGKCFALLLAVALTVTACASTESAFDRAFLQGALRLEEQTAFNAAVDGARLLSLSPSGRYAVGAYDAIMAIVDLESMEVKPVMTDYAGSAKDEYGSLERFSNYASLQRTARFVWSPDEKKIAVSNWREVAYDLRYVMNIYVIDVPTGKLQMLHGWGNKPILGPVGDVVNVCFSADSQELYFSKLRKGNALYFGSCQLKTRRLAERYFTAFVPEGMRRDEWASYLNEQLAQSNNGGLDWITKPEQVKDADWEAYRSRMENAKYDYPEAYLARTPAQSYVRAVSDREDRCCLEVYTAAGERKEYPVHGVRTRAQKILVSPQTGWGLILYNNTWDIPPEGNGFTNNRRQFLSVFQPDRSMQGYEQVVRLGDASQCAAVALENASTLATEVLNAALSPDGKYALILTRESGENGETASVAMYVMALETRECRRVEMPAGFDNEARLYMLLDGTDISGHIFPDGMLWGGRNTLLLGRKFYSFAEPKAAR